MSAAATFQGLFENLRPQEPESLLALIGLYRADQRAGKLDLGVGVYRDASGATPVLAAVKAAEAQLLSQQTTKGYIGTEGDIGFLERLKPIAFGQHAGLNLFAIQTPGGNGALRVAADLLATARPGARVFVGAPTWGNHTHILKACGLEAIVYPYFDAETQSVRFDAMMSALTTGQPGDALLLQGCCHNPTGADLTPDQWRAVAQTVSARGLTPIIDLAYQGLALGLDEDAFGARLVAQAAPDALLAYSCDKNFGLYRERVGALFAVSASPARRDLAASNIKSLVRAQWSMPPDHGAAVVRTILESESLVHDWRAELETMRCRLANLRRALAAALPSLAPLARQHGLFAQLPLTPAQVAKLRTEHSVYMLDSGRINVAGLTSETIPAFAQVYADCVGQGSATIVGERR